MMMMKYYAKSWTPRFPILDCTLFRLDGTFWLDCTLKLYYALGLQYSIHEPPERTVTMNIPHFHPSPSCSDHHQLQLLTMMTQCMIAQLINPS